LGDARPVLRQFIAAVKDIQGARAAREDGAVAAEIRRLRESWLSQWLPKLTSKDTPINPYRVFYEFIRAVNPNDTIVTHDAGSPRNQLVPFYQAPVPRSYLGWGKSHALGTGLGLIMGAKLAAPEKLCVNFMGDAAFGMTGLDFETAVRCNIPILTVVLNNNFMAAETRHMATSHKLFGTQNVGGNYAEIGRALGGWAERVEDPEQIASALRRAYKATAEGKTAMLEFITSREHAYSRFGD
jgi:acetolactate synthase-1/2/3 large subunit